MGKKEKEVITSNKERINPAERKFDNQTYKLERVEEDKETAQMLARVHQKNKEPARVAQVEVRTKAYGVFTKAKKEPKEKPYWKQRDEQIRKEEGLPAHKEEKKPKKEKPAKEEKEKSKKGC
jgi:hypothetical protein